MTNFAGMKIRLWHIIALMVLVVGCKPPTTSPRPSPGGEGVASRTLVGIDSLMWQQPDSALKVMLEFAGSEVADSMDVFEGHYCQVLVAELLFKNYYKQSNREEVLKAVGYFDSIVGMDGRTHAVCPYHSWMHGHIILMVRVTMSMTASLRLAGSTFSLCG